MASSINRPVLRFAPSPNGYLHIGHAYSALVNQRLARELGGRMLLRIEDIDLGRCRPEYEQAIYEDLAWLGVEWEQPVLRQSTRFAVYAAALEGLREEGLAYPCFCGRADLARAAGGRAEWPRDPDGAPHYSGACRRLSRAERERRFAAGQTAATRIDMGGALERLGRPPRWTEFGEGATAREIVADPGAWGDTMIGRRDVPASYHIAVVIDDAAQGVTDVARGMDLYHATSLHCLLRDLLGLPAPNYRHHHLLRDEQGAKLSKSARAKSIRSLRAEGLGPRDVRRQLGFV